MALKRQVSKECPFSDDKDSEDSNGEITEDHTGSSLSAIRNKLPLGVSQPNCGTPIEYGSRRALMQL